MKSVTKVQFLLLAAVLMLFGADTYQKPPKVVEDILNSPTTPTIQLSPTHAYAMQGRPVRYPPIARQISHLIEWFGSKLWTCSALWPRTALCPENDGLSIIPLMGFAPGASLVTATVAESRQTHTS